MTRSSPGYKAGLFRSAGLEIVALVAPSLRHSPRRRPVREAMHRGLVQRVNLRKLMVEHLWTARACGR